MAAACWSPHVPTSSRLLLQGKFLDQATGKCSDVCLVTACDACTPGDNRSCERCWPGHNQVLSAAGVRHKCLKPLGKAKAPKA